MFEQEIKPFYTPNKINLMRPNFLDRLKVSVIIFVRYINYRAIEKWSKKTFHKQVKPGVDKPETLPARDLYGSAGIPGALQVPKEIPNESKLSFWYKLPYYYLTGILFKIYRLGPIRKGIKWLPSMKVNNAFPKNKEGWLDTNGDEEFTRLRLQGPNPFLLKKSGDNTFELDYSPLFKNIFDPVICKFELKEGQLNPVSIQVGDATHLPGEEGWHKAKLVSNALDARYCVLTRHLLDTHMLIGEAYALAAFELGNDHPLRAFFRLFTYGTLEVNHFAYKLLITPASYFIQSNFITAEDTMTLFQNSMDEFSLNDLIVPMDIAKRGIDEIPDHPYVEDALDIWAVFQKFIGQYVDAIYKNDTEVVNDEALQEWYKKLASLLPNRDITDDPLNDKADLVNVICCMLYNNVSHEICGDFSPFGQSANPEHKKLINFQRLKDSDDESEPELADVFLYDQGAFAGRFNVGGNNLLNLPIDRLEGDAQLRKFVHGFQDGLRELDMQLEKRNEKRKIPFLRMMPRKWEASISF